MRTVLPLSLIVVLLCSCGTGLPKNEYFNYFNGFMEGSYIEVKQGEYIYQLQVRPAEYMALNENKTSNTLSSSEIEESISEYEEDLDFCLRISSTKHEDVLEKGNLSPTDYYKRIELLTTSFPLMIAGTTQTDTIYPSLHHFERAYKIRPFIQVLFTLSKGSPMPEDILFEDFIFQDGVQIKFKDFQDYYKNLPKLKL
jgi:hypothetical protein